MNDLPVLLRVRIAYFDMNIASILHAYIIIYIHTHLYIHTQWSLCNELLHAGALYAGIIKLTHTDTYIHTYTCMYLRSQDHILESRLHKEQKQQQHTTRSDRNAAAE